MGRRSYWLGGALAATLAAGCTDSGGPQGEDASDAGAGSSSGGPATGADAGPGDAAFSPDSAAADAKAEAEVEDGAGPGSGSDAGAPDDAGSPPPADAAPPPADATSDGGPTQVIVSAGAFDRTNTVVSFSLPAGNPAATDYVLKDTQGNALPLQVDAAGTATFVLPALPAGSQATFALEHAPSPPPDGVTAVSGADGVDLAVGSTKAMHYQTVGKLPAGIDPKYLRGGYLHPVYTPGGALVTDDYPPDHRHHHGIWSAWVHSVFQGRAIDFWNMGMGTAKVDFDSLESTWNGPVHGGLRTHHVFVDLTAPQPTTALREQWVVTLYRIEDATPYFLFDLDSTQETATTSPLMLDSYYYGGFGIRGNAAWFPADFLTSEGLDRTTGDGKAGRWCHIGGAVNGKPAGYAIVGHPSNFRAPQPMRLNPTEPFMSYAPTAAGAFTIAPGVPYKSRFRFVVSDGPADKTLLERVYNDYATPPTVDVR
jgi:hypothetical protein